MRSHSPSTAAFSVPSKHLTTGNAYFVDAGSAQASDGNAGDNQRQPMATLAGAIARCTTNNGDAIFVMPGHTETVSTVITQDVQGVSIIGLGRGRSRPTFTPSGAIDCITVTGGSTRIENLRFVTAASVTAHINVAAGDVHIKNCIFEQGAGPLIGVTVAANGDRMTVEDCLWLGTADGPDVAIDFEAGVDNHIIRNCMFNFGSNGCDLGVIRADAVTVEGTLIEDCTFLGVDTVAIDMNSSASVSDGVVRNCSIHASAAVTSIETLVDWGGYHGFEVYAHDGTNATTAAARIPLGTVT